MMHSGASTRIAQACSACGHEHDINEMVVIIYPTTDKPDWVLCLPCFHDHFVVFTADQWTVEHSFECRLSGAMVECPYHRTIARVSDAPWPAVGRWRIDEIDSEGLPSLERA